MTAYSSSPPISSSASSVGEIDGRKDTSSYVIRSPADDYQTLLTLSMLALCLSVVSIVLWFCQVFKVWKNLEYTGLTEVDDHAVVNAAASQIKKYVVSPSTSTLSEKSKMSNGRGQSEVQRGSHGGYGSYQQVHSDTADA